MLFNSFDFALFLPIVLAIYWLALRKSIVAQNAFLLLASYVFYGWWDWRFLSLIAFSSAVDFVVGIRLAKTTISRHRKFLLATSIATNIGLLSVFKYYNFFVESLVGGIGALGWTIQTQTLNIVLPVGISFYTFQTLSYSIDVYRRKIDPTGDIVAFFAFVSFFPQLVAGPIERASNLLPQFFRRRSFELEVCADGLRQILWGLFKKVVIADNCALIVNQVFEDHTSYSGSTLLLATVLFALQIYGDFSGYSDIAIGTARLFGFRLMRNFAFPYFSRDIAEFWRRWHISLSTWFRDYVYIPLGGSQAGSLAGIRNVMIIFVVSGFWHGANWTFIVWGVLHALYFIPLLILKKNRQHINIVASQGLLPNPIEFLQILTTFILTTLAWVFFRAKSVGQALDYFSHMFSSSLFTAPQIVPEKIILGQITILLVLEWLLRGKQHGLQIDKLRVPQPLRWTLYYGLVLMILLLGDREQEFIYFQF